jgi:two-component system, chemotaxis family, CheB/CheR fusion protein
MAFLFVQHLDPSRDSILPELLASVSPMPVRQVENGMELQANQVYVGPSNSIVTVVDSHLRLTPRPDTPRLFMPVDFMLRSLARSQSGRAIGVILSGGGTDGALGIQAIKEVEGITFAQDEDSAAHDSMPRSAVFTGCIDYVLDPASIAQELARIGGHPYLSTRADPVSQEAALELDEVDLQKIFNLIRDASGVDFGRYKRSTIMRRVRRRMTLKRLDHVGEYVARVQKAHHELSALYQDFLIRVTNFFRDPDAFDFLRAKIFP